MYVCTLPSANDCGHLICKPPTLHAFVHFSKIFLRANLNGGKRKICTYVHFLLQMTAATWSANPPHYMLLSIFLKYSCVLTWMVENAKYVRMYTSFCKWLRPPDLQTPTLHAFVHFSKIFLRANLNGGKRKICTINNKGLTMFCIRLTSWNKL